MSKPLLFSILIQIVMSTFVKDPCGIVCIIITYLAVFYADYVVIKWVILETMKDSLWGFLNVVLFNAIILFVVMAHGQAVFSDPGLVPLPQTRLDFSDMHSSGKPRDMDTWTVCGKCETYRPPRAHHCRICKRCIRRMDHHCPWINNCVGEQNQKYFIQFLLYVGVLSIYSIVLIVYSWIRECPNCSKDTNVQQTRILHSILVSIESALFGMFVMAVMTDQMQGIFGDETGMESVQGQTSGPYRPRKPRMVRLTEVCGRSHPIFWFLPWYRGKTKKYYDVPLLSHEV